MEDPSVIYGRPDRRPFQSFQIPQICKEPKAMARERKFTGSFNVLLSREEYDMLRALAKETSTNMSIVLRQSLRARYSMQIQKLPMCASGINCFVPHMHNAAAPLPVAPAAPAPPPPESSSVPA